MSENTYFELSNVTSNSVDAINWLGKMSDIHDCAIAYDVYSKFSFA
jgi:hypothetical protein